MGMPTRTMIAGMMLAAGLGVSSASAENLRYAHGWPAQSALGFAAAPLGEILEAHSNGALSATVYPGNLLSMAELPSGLRDGIADVGGVVPIFAPSDYPITNMLADVAMLYEVQEAGHRIGFAFVGALMDFIINDCPECVDEFAQMNQLFTAGVYAPRYLLMCTSEVSDLDQMSGTRVRVAGPQWTRWVEAVGGSPVSLAGSEVLQALSQGVVDCAITNGAELRGLGLIDAVSHITAAPLGIYGGGLVANVNLDSWARLDAEQRRALLRGAADLSASAIFNYENEAEANLEAAAERGIEMHEAAEDLVEAALAFIEANVAELPGVYANAFGVQGGQSIIDRFLPFMDRWAELTEGVESEEDLAELYWNEVLSEVDVESYGL